MIIILFVILLILFYKMFKRSNSQLPIFDLFIIQYFINYIMVPVLYYRNEGFQEASNMQMGASEGLYLSLMVPMFLCFFLGLKATGFKFIFPSTAKLEKFKSMNYDSIFFGIGFFFKIFPLPEITALNFVYFLLANFINVGFIISIMSPSRRTVYIGIVTLYILIQQTLQTAMFGELMSWMLFFILFYHLKNKPSIRYKGLQFGLLFFLVVSIQLIKGQYRKSVWIDGENSNIDLVTNKIEGELNNRSEEQISTFLVRFNQGFFFSRVIDHVPRMVEFQNGLHIASILKAIVLPRFISPDKLTSGNSLVTSKYTGKEIAKGTSMSIGIFGDSYIDFGFGIGLGLSFLLGLFLSLLLKLLMKFSENNILLFAFIPMAVYYTIRPDNDTHTAIAFLLKSLLIIYCLNWFFSENTKKLIISNQKI
jgi:hypothetical protein